MEMAESTWQNQEILPRVMYHLYLLSRWARMVSIILCSTMNNLRTQVQEASVTRRHPTQAITKVTLEVLAALQTWQLIVRTHPRFDQAFRILLLGLHRINIIWEDPICKAEGQIERTVQDSQLTRCRYQQIKVLWQSLSRSTFNKLQNRQTKRESAMPVHQLDFGSVGKRRSKQLLHI